MTRNKVELDRIAVASPCPVAWDEMAGDERVRFCNQCNLNVYNISAMTKAEAESVITNIEGRVCARFYRRADGAILTQDCPVGLRAVRKRVSRATAAGFSALVSLFGGQAVFAQQPKNEARIEVQRRLKRFSQPVMEGTVFDVIRAVIAGATVKLINERTKEEITTKTGANGRFRLSDLEKGIYTIQVFIPGFATLKQLGLDVSDDQALNLDVTLKVGGLMGEVVELPFVPLATDDMIPSGELKRKDRPRE